MKKFNLNLQVITCLVLLLVVGENVHAQRIRIGSIEYFGTKDIDVEKVKRSLSAHEGEEMNLEGLPDLITQIKVAVKTSIGAEPTDVAPVCCDIQDRWIVYVGFPGKNSQRFEYNAMPEGTLHFPPEVLTLYRETMDILMEAVHAQAKEDRTKGYAISSYPQLRAKQLAARDYAVRNAALIHSVLNHSRDTEQRVVAAHLLGYAVHNNLQIRSLVNASRDPDDGVRNNAVRALGVLAESNQEIARKIPAQDFVDMLNSGLWKDRNKGGFLLSVLTIPRDPRVLRLLRVRALDSLLEMAVWREYGHAASSRFILGRIAGIPEGDLSQMAKENVQLILRKFERSDE
ncbi:MAG TPA: hypothetical protein VIX17_27515 [Pyrinomonadaceae bacterium]